MEASASNAVALLFFGEADADAIALLFFGEADAVASPLSETRLPDNNTVYVHRRCAFEQLAQGVRLNNHTPTKPHSELQSNTRPPNDCVTDGSHAMPERTESVFCFRVREYPSHRFFSFRRKHSSHGSCLDLQREARKSVRNGADAMAVR